MQATCALAAWILFNVISPSIALDYTEGSKIGYKRNPAPDGHRCGVCPTYFQKICAFNFGTNATFIFDNHCIMDLYNCIEGTDYVPLKYEHCLYFGNFAYVHGYKYEDVDYGEDHIIVKGTKKNPNFIKYYSAAIREDVFIKLVTLRVFIHEVMSIDTKVDTLRGANELMLSS